MAKRLSDFKVLRWVLIILIVLYIVGVVPAYNEGVGSLFSRPITKLVMLVLVVVVAYQDHLVGLLLAVAYLSSVMTSGKGVSYEFPMHELPLLSSGNNNNQQQYHQQQQQQQQENMEDPTNPTMPSVSQAYEAQQREEMDASNQPSNCVALPPPSTGCDPIVGYNAPFDCVCAESCTEGCDKKGRSCLCKGVSTWSDELNAQGLNYPMGNPGGQVGASF